MPEKMNNHIDTELNLASKHTDIAEKILIVDDEKLHQYSLMALMKQNDYDVDSVSSVETPFIAKKKPTVITTQQLSSQLAPTGS